MHQMRDSPMGMEGQVGVAGKYTLWVTGFAAFWPVAVVT
jgi:hypothetical protein